MRTDESLLISPTSFWNSSGLVWYFSIIYSINNTNLVFLLFPFTLHRNNNLQYFSKGASLLEGFLFDTTLFSTILLCWGTTFLTIFSSILGLKFKQKSLVFLDFWGTFFPVRASFALPLPYWYLWSGENKWGFWNLFVRDYSKSGRMVISRDETSGDSLRFGLNPLFRSLSFLIFSSSSRIWRRVDLLFFFCFIIDFEKNN